MGKPSISRSLGIPGAQCGANRKHGRGICKAWVAPGFTRCRMHGGAGKLATQKAKQRLEKMLPGALARLEQLRDQSDHLPTAMMAVKEILNRTVGPTGGEKSGNSGPIIQIGFFPPDDPPNVSVEVIEPARELPPYDALDAAADSDPDL